MFRWRIGREPLWNEFGRLRNEMDALMNAMSGTRPHGLAGWRSPGIFPLLNVRKLEDAFVVTAEIPGMNTDDLSINVHGDTLTVKGTRKPDTASPDAAYHRRERPAGEFQRSITLPSRVEPDSVTATYKTGILTVNLPLEKAALPKKIAVKVE